MSSGSLRHGNSSTQPHLLPAFFIDHRNTSVARGGTRNPRPTHSISLFVVCEGAFCMYDLYHVCMTGAGQVGQVKGSLTQTAGMRLPVDIPWSAGRQDQTRSDDSNWVRSPKAFGIYTIFCRLVVHQIRRRYLACGPSEELDLV